MYNISTRDLGSEHNSSLWPAEQKKNMQRRTHHKHTQIRIPARQKRDTSRFRSSQITPTFTLHFFGFLQTASVFLFLYILPPWFLLSLLPQLSLSPHPLSHPPSLLSDKLFVGCNPSWALLSRSQVLSLSLFLCLSILQRAKALPSLSLSLSLSLYGCHHFLSTLIVPGTFFFLHTHKINVLNKDPLMCSDSHNSRASHVQVHTSWWKNTCTATNM